MQHKRIAQRENEIKYFKYSNYKNVRSSKIKRMIQRDVVSQTKSGARGAQSKDHLKIKQSISKKMSSISFLAKNKERRMSLRKTLRKKLSTMVVSMLNIF